MNNNSEKVNNSSVMVTLVPSEGENITVPLAVANVSVLFQTMTDVDDSDGIGEIPVPNVSHDTLKKVIEFCEYNVDHELGEIEKPLKSKNISESVPEWYANYIDLEKTLLFDVICAANYLDIPGLLKLGCAKVASKIKGKDPKQIREEFGIENDLTEDEEQSIKEEAKVTA